MLLDLVAKIKAFDVLSVHWPLVLDAGIVLVSVPSLICASFMYCHRIVRRTVLDNTPSKDSGAFCWRLLYSHYRGPYFHETEVKFSGYFRKTEPNEYMVEPLHIYLDYLRHRFHKSYVFFLLACFVKHLIIMKIEPITLRRIPLPNLTACLLDFRIFVAAIRIQCLWWNQAVKFSDCRWPSVGYMTL